MFRMFLLLGSAALLPAALSAQSAILAGKIEGDTYFSATGEFSLTLPVLRDTAVQNRAARG